MTDTSKHADNLVALRNTVRDSRDAAVIIRHDAFTVAEATGALHPEKGSGELVWEVTNAETKIRFNRRNVSDVYPATVRTRGELVTASCIVVQL